MKKFSPWIILLLLIINSCSSSNRIFITQDDFKNRSVIKLNHTLKGYSDEIRKFRSLAHYRITFKHFHSVTANGVELTIMDVKLSTLVRAYEVEPALYISIDDKRYQIDASNAITKMYQQGESSTSAETSVSTSTDEETDEETTETTTTYSTSSSHDTYQLMQLRFYPEPEILKQIAESRKTNYRLYIDNEIIDIPLKRKNRRKFEKFVELI